MKHYLFIKLNYTKPKLFKNLFIDHYKEITKNKKYTEKYYDTFIDILDELILDDNDNTIQIGDYFLDKHKLFFNTMLHDYCITNYNNHKLTDANYIISSINNLLH